MWRFSLVWADGGIWIHREVSSLGMGRWKIAKAARNRNGSNVQTPKPDGKDHAGGGRLASDIPRLKEEGVIKGFFPLD